MTTARRLGSILAAWVLAAAAPVLAQAVPPPGSVATPPSRAEIERVPLPVPRRRARLTISGGIERAPCPLDDPRFASVTVKLDRVVFDKLEAVAPESLSPATADYLGRTVPISAVCAIRDVAATMLRARGYLAAIQVPPQRITDGTLHLTVLMAHLVAVHVRGNPGHAERLLTRFLERLKQAGPFNQHDAERALLLAGDLPGFDVHLTLRSAGNVAGEVVGDISVTRTPYSVDANVQNYGSHAVGRWSGLVSATANDILGIGDRATLGVFNTFDVREQSVIEAAYEAHPLPSGLAFAARFTYAWTRPSIGDGDPVRARTLLGTLEANYPLVRRQAGTLRLAGGIDLVDQHLTFSGLPFTTDRLRVLYGRADFELVDPQSVAGNGASTPSEPRWRVNGALELRQGIAGLGASHDCGGPPFYARCIGVTPISRLDADPQATLLRFAGAITYKLARQVTMVVSPRAQAAVSPLLSFEQFTAGNYTVGRGYDPGALSGDNGYGVAVEGRFGPIALRHPDGVVLQPFLFADMARTRTLGPIASVYDRDSLVSLGGGTRIALRNRALLEVLLAVPVGPPPVTGQPRDVRFLINLSGHFEGLKR